jgi:hypothetical protein
MSKLFNELLTMADSQDQPQRLLMMFARSERVKSKKKSKMSKGTISPVMCVDKLPEELSTFDELVKEADSISKDWDMVFFASLSGEGQLTPSTDDAEHYLNQMVSDVSAGNSLDRYVIFDREQNPIVVETR